MQTTPLCACLASALDAQALFRQLFSFMNVQLFNQLLLRRECCSFSNGEYVKTGLLQVRLLREKSRGTPCCSVHRLPFPNLYRLG